MKIKNYLQLVLNPTLLMRIERMLFFLLIIFLPTQLGKHFWPDFASVLGIRIDYLSPTVYFTDIIIGLLFVTWFTAKVQSAKFKVQSSNFKKRVWIFISVLLFLTINIAISGRVLGGTYSLFKLLEMVFVGYYTAKFIIDKNIFKKIILLLGISGILQSVLAIAQFINQGSIGRILYFVGERAFNSGTPGIANASLNGTLALRPYGTLPHPNVLAGYLVVVMILVLFTAQFQKAKQESRVKSQESRLVWKILTFLLLNSYILIQVAFLILGTIALFLSMSRIAILLWIIICIYYILNRAKIIYGLVIIGFLGFLFLSPLGPRFTNIKTSDEAITQRSILNDKAFQMIAQNPLLGVGLGNFLPSLVKIQKPLSTSTYLQPVHNIFLLVAAETGLIGLGFFVWFIYRTYKRLKIKDLRSKTSMLFALSAILILGMFDHYWLTLQQGQLLFAFVIGLSWSNFNYQE